MERSTDTYSCIVPVGYERCIIHACSEVNLVEDGLEMCDIFDSLVFVDILKETRKASRIILASKLL